MPLVRRRDLGCRLVDGEAIILDKAAGRVHQLNATASYIWSECMERSAADIAAHLAARFEVARDTVLADVLDTVSKFEQLGLLVQEDVTRESAGEKD
jgi:hypothetical protein